MCWKTHSQGSYLFLSLLDSEYKIDSGETEFRASPEQNLPAGVGCEASERRRKIVFCRSPEPATWESGQGRHWCAVREPHVMTSCGWLTGLDSYSVCRHIFISLPATGGYSLNWILLNKTARQCLITWAALHTLSRPCAIGQRQPAPSQRWACSCWLSAWSEFVLKVRIIKDDPHHVLQPARAPHHCAVTSPVSV